MKTHLAALLFTPCLSCSASAQFGSGDDNLVKNGNFSEISAENLPEHWKISHPNFLEKTETSLEILTEGDTNFLRITKKAATSPDVGTQEIQIPPGATLLRLSCGCEVETSRGARQIGICPAWASPSLIPMARANRV